MINLKNTKILVFGIQGSGKTELAKHLTNFFKKPYWYLMHLDDMKNMPKKVKIIKADKMDIYELDEIFKSAIEMGKKGELDLLVVDEADMFLKSTLLQNTNDAVINHRHYNFAIMFITRRPQDIPTKIVESSEHTFIFAVPNSDNVDRKLKALDKDIIPMMKQDIFNEQGVRTDTVFNVSKDKHNFIHKRLGEKPVFMKPIKLKQGGK